MYKDLSDSERDYVEGSTVCLVRDLIRAGQSLALAREAMINAFDRAAEELDGGKDG